jgi:radical SAM superfamily enzyme YgiQ (UPF0313 family)
MLETGRCVDLECLECGPDLGIASLLGSLGSSQIKTHLVAGSTRYLKDVLVTDSDELVEILTQGKIRTPDCLETNVNMLRNLIHDYGEGWFREHLGDVYRTLRSRSIGDYLSIPRLRYSKDIVDCILSIYGSAVIQKAGGQLSIVRRLFEEIERSKPDMVGFSIKGQFGVLSDPFFVAASQRVKEELDVPIVVGGQFTSGQPVETLHSSLTLSMRNIDYLVRGNADLSLPELIHIIERGETPKAVAGVSYRDGGRIVCNPVRIIRDLDALPVPDFSQFDLDAYAPVRILPMLTARGCPWRRCTFCSHYRSYGDDYVSLSIEKVIQTLTEYREKYKTRFVVFNDETLPSARAREISLAMLREGMDDIYIDTYGRMDDGYTKELLNLMSKVGFRVVFWGLESGCQRILDGMDKGIRTETMSRVLKDSHEAGMANFCFIMFGFPGEERREAMETYSFLNKNREYVDLIAPNIFSLSETSPIGRDPGRWGVVLDDSKYGYHVERGMQPAEVEQLASEMYLRVESMVSDRFLDWWRSGVLPDPYWRNLLFIFHSKGLLGNSDAKRTITQRETWTRLHPIFIGRLVNLGSRGMAASAFWEDTPSDHVTLNSFEHAFCSLADGTNTLSGIFESLRKSEPSMTEEDVAGRVLESLRVLDESHLIVFFSKFSHDGGAETESAPSLKAADAAAP